MSLPEALRTSAEIVERVGEALSWISHLTKNTTDDKAVVVLRLIGTAVESVLDNLGIRIDPGVVQRHLDAALAQIGDSDVTVDQAIIDKSKPEPESPP